MSTDWDASAKEGAGVHLPELGQIDPRELSPHVVVRWRDFALSQRPYSSPEEEYVRSPYPVSLKVLRERWEGLWPQRELDLLYETPELKRQRLLYRDQVMQQALETSLLGDVQFVKRRLEQELVDLCALIEEVQGNIGQGYEYARVKGGAAGPLGYVQQPLTVDSKHKLVSSRIGLSDCLARRLGLASEIVRHVVEEDSGISARLEELMRFDPEFAALQHVLQHAPLGRSKEAPAPALPGDAQHAQYEREHRRARVIEVEALAPTAPPSMAPRSGEEK